MNQGVCLDNVSIVLVRPRFPENIGAAARAMRNMGIGQLILVDPENCDLTRVLKMATHSAADLVEAMDVYGTLREALAPFGYVVGTTARLGKQRQTVGSPAKMVQELIPISRNNRVAFVFGPEDRGLSNEDLRLCHRLVNIPTASFSSLNLAQSVMVICYELFTAVPAPSGVHAPRLAERHELDGMYEQVKDILLKIDFIKPDNPDYWMNRLRHFFTRMQLQAREVSIIRGICRQILWYGGRRYQDGLEAGRKENGV